MFYSGEGGFRHLVQRPVLSRADGLSVGREADSDLTEVRSPRLVRGVEMNAARLISECKDASAALRGQQVLRRATPHNWIERWPRYLCHFSSCQSHNRHGGGVGISHGDGTLPYSDRKERKEPSLI